MHLLRLDSFLPNGTSDRLLHHCTVAKRKSYFTEVFNNDIVSATHPHKSAGRKRAEEAPSGSEEENGVGDGGHPRHTGAPTHCLAQDLPLCEPEATFI